MRRKRAAQRALTEANGNVYGANDESPASAMTTGLSVSPLLNGIMRPWAR